MFDEEGNTDARSIILQTVQERNHSTFFELCYFIHELLGDSDNAKKTLAVLEDQEFIREVKQLEAIIEDSDNKIYYYGRDEQSPTKLSYRKEVERVITNKRNEQLKLLALQLKKLNDEEDFDL